MNHVFDNTSKTGTASGTLLTIIANINSGDLVKTAILAAVGALVSFIVTHFIKLFMKRFKK